MHLVQLSSVAQLCLTLCDPMNRGMPGLPSPSGFQSQIQIFVGASVSSAGGLDVGLLSCSWIPL